MQDGWDLGFAAVGALWCVATLVFSLRAVGGLLERRREREEKEEEEEPRR